MSNKELPSMLSLWNQAGGLAITKFLYTAAVLVVTFIVAFIAYFILDFFSGIFPTALNVILFLVIFPFAIMALSIPSLVLYSLFTYGEINPENVYYVNGMLASLKAALYILAVSLPYILFDIASRFDANNAFLKFGILIFLIPPIIISFRFILIAMIAFFEGKKFAEAKEESTEIMVGKKLWFFGLLFFPMLIIEILRGLIKLLFPEVIQVIILLPLECFLISFIVALFLLFYKHVKGDPREVIAVPE